MHIYIYMPTTFTGLCLCCIHKSCSFFSRFGAVFVSDVLESECFRRFLFFDSSVVFSQRAPFFPPCPSSQ